MNPNKLDLRLNSLRNSKDTSRVKNLYTLFWYEEIWYQAYQNIYSNRGAFTKGINSDTLDDFNKIRVNNIIQLIKDNKYSPTPVRRVLIPKTNGKTRPLGIPTGTDKLVQEVCRIILEAIYEPKFSNLSYGFRPNRSCHSALKEVCTWAGTKWWIEFDIKGCFDNINHTILLNTLKERIDDDKFISLIQKFLKAGYIENWKYNTTHSGTPQGGIISPILANVYLDKLDTFIENKCNIINKTENKKKITPEYNKVMNKLNVRRKQWRELKSEIEEMNEFVADNIYSISNKDNLKEILNIFTQAIKARDEIKDQRLKDNTITNLSREICRLSNLELQDVRWLTNFKFKSDKLNNYDIDIKNLEKELSTKKCTDTSVGLIRAHYARYADDFIIGFIGSKAQATSLLNEIQLFINTELKLDLAENKTNIVYSIDGIEFLGYSVSIPKYTDSKIIVETDNSHQIRRRARSRPVLKIPVNKLIKFVQKNKYGSYVDNTSTHRSFLENYDDIEIIKQYNAELRGLLNYYIYAVNAKHLIGRVQWLAHYSLIKTIGAKHKCSVAQVFKTGLIKTKKHPIIGKIWYTTVNNKDVEVFNIKDVDSKSIFELTSTELVDDNLNVKND